MMAPDVYFGEEAVHWPAAYLAGEYNSRLRGLTVPRGIGDTMHLVVTTITCRRDVGSLIQN